VLSGGAVFGPREVEAMRGVPELAFINCCYLGRIDPASKTKASALGKERPRFAASVAEALITNGVRCVVAAGWAVDDAPAKLFATRFYEALMDRRTFAEAVGHAREQTHQKYPQSNTWAAYQCYGDPDWRYVPADDAGGRQSPENRPVIAQADLKVELETLVVQAKYDATASDRVRERLMQLEAAYGGKWGGAGAVAEAFGAAYGEINKFDDAIRWYSRAVAAQDGTASLRASEQLANLRARRAIYITTMRRHAVKSRPRSVSCSALEASTRRANAKACSARPSSGWRSSNRNPDESRRTAKRFPRWQRTMAKRKS